VPLAVEFLRRSMRADGSWPIDTNLATWATTLSVKALGDDLPGADAPPISDWLRGQQYTVVHPFTCAAPGGWAWTDLPGGVPDADDTSGALVALAMLHPDPSAELVAQAAEGCRWLLDLQNRDGGVPTFCRGWGTLPFDRSTPEITAHSIWAWAVWAPHLPAMRGTIDRAVSRARRYLMKNADRSAQGSVSWSSLWFGNEWNEAEDNPIHGTANVVIALLSSGSAEWHDLASEGCRYLLQQQHGDGSWGSVHTPQSSIEETALAVHALCLGLRHDLAGSAAAIRRGCDWLIDATQGGCCFSAKPIGLYFAKLWYHERSYPVIWTLAALRAAKCLETKTTL
jgi:squalene-hopene/tetraprenyl-beta-curcumene cyclase